MCSALCKVLGLTSCVYIFSVMCSSGRVSKNVKFVGLERVQSMRLLWSLLGTGCGFEYKICCSRFGSPQGPDSYSPFRSNKPYITGNLCLGRHEICNSDPDHDHEGCVPAMLI